MTYTITSQPANGTATITPAGVVTYTRPTPSGLSDSLTVSVSDGTAAPVPIVVTLSATPLPPAVGNIPTQIVVEDGSGTLNLIPLIGNNTVNPLVFSQPTTASGTGSASINAAGVLTFSPAPNFSGTETVSFTVSNGVGDPLPVSVAFNVTEVPDAPVAGTLSQTITINTTATVDLRTLVTDPDTAVSSLSFALVNPPAGATLSGSILTFAPGAAERTVAVQFTASDPAAAGTPAAISNIGTVTFNVIAGGTVSGTAFIDQIDNIGDVVSRGAAPVRNGRFDAGRDVVLAGIPVQLIYTDGNGEQITRLTYTNGDGQYTFQNVPFGNARVIYDVPTGGRARTDATLGNRSDFTLNVAGPTTSGPQTAIVVESMGANQMALQTIFARARPAALPSTVEQGEGLAVLMGNLPDGSFGQTRLQVGMGFDNADFIQVDLNSTGDQALLSVVDDGVVKIASIGGNNLSVSRLADGSEVVRIFGGFDDNDLGFVDANPGDINSPTGGAISFAQGVDEVLRRMA